MWVTESWHGVGPAWTGTGGVDHRHAARVVSLPGRVFCQGEYAHLYLRRGILGLAIVVTQTGIGTAMGEALLRIMPLDADSPFTSFWRWPGLPRRSTSL